MTPIAFFRTRRTKKYDAPRQGGLESSAEEGEVLAVDGINFPQCCTDLEGFSHLWLLYVFDQSMNWKPMVLPPTSEVKRGVFATRSPHRPNPLGLSCVELVSVKPDRLVVRSFDLLDGTPILDIKPYVTRYDSVPNAREGWVAEPVETFDIEWSELALAQAQWIERESDWNIREVLGRTLRVKPFDKDHKRFERDGDSLIYSLKTWRARVRHVSSHSFLIEEIFTGENELNG